MPVRRSAGLLRRGCCVSLRVLGFGSDFVTFLLLVFLLLFHLPSLSLSLSLPTFSSFR